MKFKAVLEDIPLERGVQELSNSQEQLEKWGADVLQRLSTDQQKKATVKICEQQWVLRRTIVTSPEGADVVVVPR